MNAEPARAFLKFYPGQNVQATANRFVKEVRDLLLVHGDGSKILAVDKIMIAGLRALERENLTVVEGEPLAEQDRSIKCDDEIKAMRCAMYSTERAVARCEKL
jgi:Xaa-Pro dipeptidase